MAVLCRMQKSVVHSSYNAPDMLLNVIWWGMHSIMDETFHSCAEPKLRKVMAELAYNLESFNPAFTAVLLKVQSTIGHSDYVARDMALKHLIQPLAGEYGMHNGQEQGATASPCLQLREQLLAAHKSASASSIVV